MKLVSKICVLLLLTITFFFVSEKSTCAYSDCPERTACIAAETAEKAACTATATTNYNTCTAQYVTEPYEACMQTANQNESDCYAVAQQEYQQYIDTFCVPLGPQGSPNRDSCDNEAYWNILQEGSYTCYYNKFYEVQQCDLDQISNASYCTTQRNAENSACDAISHNCSSIVCP